MPQRAGRDRHARQDRAGMTLQQAFIGTGIFQYRRIKIAHIRIHRSHGRHRMALAQDEDIRAGICGIRHIGLNIAAIEQSRQRRERRIRAANVNAMVYSAHTLPDCGQLQIRAL